MDLYRLSPAPAPLESTAPLPETDVLLLLTPEELDRCPAVPGLEHVLPHMPSPRGIRICKAESRRTGLCGAIITPRHTRDQAPIAFTFLLAPHRLVLCDESGAVRSMVQRLIRENHQKEYGAGVFFYEFLELLIARDLRRLLELEEQLDRLEEQVLAGEMEDLNTRMTVLRKELIGWIRYYTQLNDLVCELQENENGYFSENELRLFRMVEKRIDRLQSEAQSLREYSIQVRELFQGEIDIRQNRIMKILTIVTTIFLPLSLIAGWYGMNFSNMPELHWRYGYPVTVFFSVLVVLLCLWIMKKKKFW